MQNVLTHEPTLQTVLDTVLDGLIIIDPKGRIERFNRAAERIFGYTEAELIGKNVKILMPPPYRDEHDGYLRNRHETEGTKVIGVGREVSARRKDGSEFPIELGVNTMKIDGLPFFIGTIRDITERKAIQKRNEDEANRLRAIMATVIDGMIIIDTKGIIRNFNPSAEGIFGYSSGEVLGKNIRMLMPEPFRGEHDGYLKNYKNTGEQKVIGVGREVAAQRKDGTIFPMELGINTMSLDGERLFVGTIRDISERREAEKAINAYVAKLAASNQELDDFAYIASHDLKEPIRGLGNNALFLKEDFEEELGEAGNKRIRRMVYLCQRMERLVDDLLYFSRLGRRELAVQTIDLNTVIEDIRLTLEATGTETSFEISVPQALPEILCDVPRVTELYRNLITNALKYNDKEKKLIEIGTLPDGHEQKSEVSEHTFYVRDNGIGIPEHFHQDVFRIFKRLNDEADDKKGTGVGLTFVKKIVERHNGKIWLTSEPDQGSCFYFTLNLTGDGRND